MDFEENEVGDVSRLEVICVGLQHSDRLNECLEALLLQHEVIAALRWMQHIGLESQIR